MSNNNNVPYIAQLLVSDKVPFFKEDRWTFDHMIYSDSIASSPVLLSDKNRAMQYQNVQKISPWICTQTRKYKLLKVSKTLAIVDDLKHVCSF